MNETVQWIVTAAAVAAAVVYLAVRFVRRKNTCPYADRCGGCKIDMRQADECPERRGYDSQAPRS